MNSVSKLKWQAEASLIDQSVLDALIKEYGEHRADMIISDTAETITIRLNAVRRMIDMNALYAVRFEAQRITELANTIGMVRLGEVVSMIGACAMLDDIVSLRAILARLERIEELSLAKIWGLDEDIK